MRVVFLKLIRAGYKVFFHLKASGVLILSAVLQW
jgi:hypothetical protein